MKKKNCNFFFILALAVLFSIQAKAQLQNVAATSGDHFTGSTYSISYTIGEAAISTLVSGNLILTQGFQQPRLIVTAIDEIKGLSVQIKAYPNPTTDFVMLETSGKLLPGSVYQLFNMNGSLIEERRIDGLLTGISFQALISSTYILRVSQNSKTIKTFKIIKK